MQTRSSPTATPHAPQHGTRGYYACPPNLLLRAAARGRQPMVVAAAGASDVLQAVHWAAAFGLITPILVGDQNDIRAALADLGETDAPYKIVPAIGEDQAAEIAADLVAAGEARILMKGHLHTDTLMRAVLDGSRGLRRAGRLSHVFAMHMQGAARELLITDAALNIAPDARTMTFIVRHAIEVAAALRIDHPRIAMLSATETINRAMPSSMAADAFAKSFRDEAESKNCSISGPLALDVALSSASAALKGLTNDTVAGQADILVVPNIETGNALFKILVHLLHATAIGVVLGAAVPIVLTSRADPVEAKLASIALACLLASPAPLEDSANPG
ncbi:MAG: phosphate acyltransferase [Acidiphilium sp.]